MTPIPPPTPDDLARDAAADLAVCEAALDQWDQKAWDRFGALARDALPAWIRRAAAAEQAVADYEIGFERLDTETHEVRRRAIAAEAERDALLKLNPAEGERARAALAGKPKGGD